MRELVNYGNRRDIERVAGVGLKGANAALAEDHVVVAARHDVFGREQQLFQGRRDAALQQHRLAYLTEFTKQIEILHVARSHLQNVNIRQHERDLRNRHDLADHQQLVLVSALAQQRERLLAETLK